MKKLSCYLSYVALLCLTALFVVPLLFVGGIQVAHADTVAAVATVQPVSFIDAFLAKIPAWLQTASLVVTAASTIAAITPTPRDDSAIAVVRKVIDFLALNFGGAKNAGKN
jgi:hypothetical protein